jgi:ATP-dependent protease ClpP protease subunit
MVISLFKSAKNYSRRVKPRMALTLITLIYFFCSAQVVSASTQVRLDGHQIIYRGGLTAEANAKVFALYEKATVKPTLLSIRSPGGPIDVGLALGEWTHQQRLDVRVDEFCFSSCANYIFTAGVKKILGKDAIIGFHGGASSDSFNMAQMNATLARIPAEQREKVREDVEQQLKAYIESNRKREADFYQAISVAQKITTLGQEGVYHIYQKTGFRGWYYSLDDMEKLGLKNIHVVGGDWNPERQENRYKIYRVSLENI